MYAYQTQDQFDDFYDSLHDNNENEYGFGKMVNQVSSNKKMPKASSYQTIKSAFSAEKPFAKKISETSFKNLDQDKTNTVGSASPVKFSKIIEQPTASTMASFNSVNSINSQSNSHISIGNSNSQNVISAEKKKSKNKSKNKKKKQQSKNNNSHLNSKKKNVSTENDFKSNTKLNNVNTGHNPDHAPSAILVHLLMGKPKPETSSTSPQITRPRSVSASIQLDIVPTA
eukprot:CAMPEP_0114582844 /NCGR_PEP_ID=MMETSP0125-20121206/6715_1 /TAXON_ID=485358 ORGANISM="Aristerostoma sp., Strain ATCC 50986" /NCGR_SAMPLE_ID=MMETSP0125 /ASSEMBLY_ACC=CAM_ASM_000245 /LENGTH=227 /DNA_ID=CAMNT_0001775983 /DNA_START=67 /DNA_END=751 /DNA_ORIENTATION=+